MSFNTTEASTVDSGMSISSVHIPNTDNSPNDQASISSDPPPPTLTVKTAPEYSSVGVEADMKTVVACVNLKARELPDDDDNHRAPVDIIVALDVSGSMTGSKLELCKKTLRLLLRVLFAEDRFGLICYSGDAFIEVPVQKMSETNKKSSLEKIAKLRARDCTNISSAVGLTYQEMRQIENPNAVQTVFLLTDGHANAGIKNARDLVEFTKNFFAGDSTEREEDTTRNSVDRNSADSNDNSMLSSVTAAATRVHPISLHCFGFGTDHNSNLLESMSSTSPGGSYYFVESDVDVGSAFGDALGGILSVVAQNVVVTLTVPEEAKTTGVEIVNVYHDHNVKRDNGSYTVVVGDFYAEETRDVLFEVRLAVGASAEEGLAAHAAVAVAYTDTLKMVPAGAEATTCDIFRPPGSEVSSADPHVDVQWTRYQTAEAMARANEMARANNFAGAKEHLQGTKLRIRGTRVGKSSAFTETLASLEADVETLEDGLRSESEFKKRGTHNFSNFAKTHRTQRRMKGASSGAADMMYSSKQKCSMMEKLSLKK